jgi:Tfp pilus assembly protein PilF
MSMHMRASFSGVLLGLTLTACGGGQPPPSSRAMFTDDVTFEDEREAPAARHPATEVVERGESALAAGQVAEAKALFEEAVEADANDARAQLDLGLVLELENDYDAAEAHYRAAVALDPEFPEALNNLGLLLRDQQRYDEAVPLLRRAVLARPGYPAALLNLAMALEETEETAEAIDVYRRAVRAAPDDPMPRVNLGLLLLAEGQTDPARIELRRALPHAGGSVAMLEAIGNGLRRAGDPTIARQALESAVTSAESPSPALRSELALAQNAAGDRDAAIATLRAVLTDAPDYATAHYVLGALLVEAGGRDEGVQHLRRVSALEPQGPHAERARAQLRALGVR